MEDDQRLHTLVHEVTLYGLRFTIARSRKTAVLHHYVCTIEALMRFMKAKLRVLQEEVDRLSAENNTKV